MTPISFGILSAAHYHSFHWGNAAQANDNVSLVGLWDDDLDRGREMCRKLDTPFFEDLNLLLERCDAVGITSETSRHVDLAEAACGVAAHVLMEKPMARDLEECARIGECVDASGITFMQNFPKRYDPAHKELASIIEQGVLGEITLVRVRHGNDLKLPGNPAADEWYADPVAAGGGALMDEGVHAADLLLWLLGYPEAATGFADRPVSADATDTTSVALFRYPSGAIGEIATGHAFSGGDASIEVHGTDGVLILGGADLGSIELASPPFLKLALRGENEFRGFDTVPGLRDGKPKYHGRAVDTFARVLVEGESPPVSFEDGWKSVAMVHTAYDAMRTGMVRDLPLSLRG